MRARERATGPEVSSRSLVLERETCELRRRPELLVSVQEMDTRMEALVHRNVSFRCLRVSLVSAEYVLQSRGRSGRGMRCRVRVQTNDPRVKVDLRTNWKQAATSIVSAAKEAGTSGEVSLAVPDDSYEGVAASVVLLDAEDKVIASQTARVGEKS